MIEEILIRDLGVISEAKLEFGKGLTVLTGETGAGKTMVLNALGLLLGERSDSSAIRKDQPQAFVEGRWLLPQEIVDALKQEEIELEDGELLLSRSVSQEGRSRATLSGRSVPVGLLAEIGQRLVVVHGQSDQIRLKSSAAQREALDQFARSDLANKLEQYREVFNSWKQSLKSLEEIRSNLEARNREAEEIRAASEELEKLDPKPGEDQELAELAEKLTHVEDLRIAAIAAHEELNSESLDGSADAITLIGKARKALEAVSSHDPALEELAEQLRQIGFSLRDTTASLASYLTSLDAEGAGNLERIQQRRAELASAIKRYGPTLDDVIAFREGAGARLMELDSSSTRIDELEASEKELSHKAHSLAKEITSLRQSAAKDLAAAVTKELTALAMAGASLEVQVSEQAELT
ncbi:MAG: DNA repair protein RecN, partial [Actinomycetota bacterium]